VYSHLKVFKSYLEAFIYNPESQFNPHPLPLIDIEFKSDGYKASIVLVNILAVDD
jgi:hypothetical protein